jgi:predicted solute-binding protein
MKTQSYAHLTENMYTNIPTKDIRNTINDILNRNINKITKDEILDLRNILEQNYMQINEQYYTQTEGLAVGAPKSTILAETYIKHRTHQL